MEFRQLNMLLAVVECGGYSKAGERLRISHSAIHRQIRLLEEELGERLVARVGNQVRPTKGGVLLLEHARRIHQLLQQAQRRLGELKQLQAGELRVGTVTPALVQFLPQVLTRFRKKYPAVLVRGVTRNPDDLIGLVREGVVDLGIALVPEEARGVLDLRYEPLFQEEFVVAVGRDHPLARRKSVRLAELKDSPFIMYAKGTYIRRFLDRMFENARLSPTIAMELENEAFIEKMIVINMGIAFLSKRRVMADKLQYVRISDRRVFFELGLLFPNSSYTPRVVQEFATFCREAAAGLK